MLGIGCPDRHPLLLTHSPPAPKMHRPRRRPPARAGSFLGQYLPLATGVSTVRYPIPQRTFKYVAPVQSVTDETCHFRTFTADKICSDQKRRCYAFERLE
jgi:hypothetical protein